MKLCLKTSFILVSSVCRVTADYRGRCISDSRLIAEPGRPFIASSMQGPPISCHGIRVPSALICSFMFSTHSFPVGCLPDLFLFFGESQYFLSINWWNSVSSLSLNETTNPQNRMWSRYLPTQCCVKAASKRRVRLDDNLY